MTIEDVIRERGIREILHFTTNRGITGILASNAVKSRQRLSKDEYLEHILKFNCPDRTRDSKWHDYVNLSITKVNLNLFGISIGKWHLGMEGFWCILSFSPEILLAPGVVFTTTNNIYTAVKRHEGAEGLEQLFAREVRRWPGNMVTRKPSTPQNEPTCNQAEVLYPSELPLDYLRSIYVNDLENACAVESLLRLYRRFDAVECIERPDLF